MQDTNRTFFAALADLGVGSYTTGASGFAGTIAR